MLASDEWQCVQLSAEMSNGQIRMFANQKSTMTKTSAVNSCSFVVRGMMGNAECIIIFRPYREGVSHGNRREGLFGR